MKVLVTGHRGYVGSVLTGHLLRRGDQVHGLDADWFAACALSSLPSVPWQPLDIRDTSVTHFLGFDAVIHLAGLSNDPLGDLNPTLTHQINGTAAVRLARLAKQAGVRRFVAVSSCSVYGAAGDHWIDEDALPAPVTPYAEAKLMMERGLAELNSRQFEVVIARPGTVFGASPMLRFDLVLNNLVAWALATDKIHFKSDGQAWRPLLHVQDLARALAYLASAPADDVAGRGFNIGFNQQNLRVIELAEHIKQVLPATQLEFGHEADSDQRSYRVDCRRLAATWPLASEHQVGLKQGIQELVDWLSQHPSSVNEFEGAKFQRLAHLIQRQQAGELDDHLYGVANA